MHQKSINVDIYIKLLSNIFYNYEYINNKANQNFEKEQQFEICHIVNQKYINKIKQILNYKEFSKHKIKEIFNKYNIGSNNDLMKNNEFIKEIRNVLSQTQFLNYLCSIDKKIFKDIRNDIELTEIKRIKLKTEGLFFYKDLEIVTNNLCKIFKEEHLVLKEDKMLNSKCLFG